MTTTTAQQATAKQIDYIRDLRDRTRVFQIDGSAYVPYRWYADLGLTEAEALATAAANRSQDLASLPRTPSPEWMAGATTREEKMARGRAWRQGGAAAEWQARQDARYDAMVRPLDGLTAADASHIIDTLK